MHCGALQPVPPELAGSEKLILPAAMLCLVLGVFGAHRFYAGRPLSAVLQLLTLGGFGIWWVVDLIMLVTGHFKDADENVFVLSSR